MPVNVRIESELPWGGKVCIFIKPEQNTEFTLNLRMPSWAISNPSDRLSTASGYDPRESNYETIRRGWTPEVETLEFNFDISIKLRRAHPKVRRHAGKVAVTRGPLVYCLESATGCM